MNIFRLWARLGRTQDDMICIACAIRRLYAAFGFHHFPATVFHNFNEILPQSNSDFTDLKTQKRPNTEPQGVPEALETHIR